jgi:hypothetical protein
VGQVVSSELINNIYEKQRDRWTPGATSFWASLKEYFDVSNQFVFSKIKLVLYPLSQSSWQRLRREDVDSSVVDTADSNQGQDGNNNSSSSSHSKFASPRDDVNAPDLYIPFMSFITYVLLVGLLAGIGSSGSNATSTFSPSDIVQCVWRLICVQCVEASVIKFGFSFIGFNNMLFLDSFAYTGYKYIGLCLTIAARLFGNMFTIIIALYTSLMFGYFFLKTLSPVVPQVEHFDQSPTSLPPRHFLILGFALFEILSSLFLNWV